MLGVGVMIGLMGGNESSVKAFLAAQDKRITALEIATDKYHDANALRFTFEDGSMMQLRDDGQSCCEHRHMSTDDDLAYYVGAVLLGAEVSDGPPIHDEHGESHDTQFLKVKTDRGVFTCVNHNEHNGYYGGFNVVAEAVES